MGEKLTFTIDKIQLVEEASDSQLSKVKMYIVSEGNNKHQMPISKQTIQMSKHSLVGKPVLCKYNKHSDSFEGHELEEVPVGVFLREDEIYEEEIDGKFWLTAEAYIWKFYFPEIMRVFEKQDGESAVSMEIELLEVEKNEDGLQEIKLFAFLGVTLIGTTPAIDNAKATVIKFSDMVEKTEKLLAEFFSKDEIGKSDSINIDNSKESSVDGKWSNPGAKLYKPILKAKNYKSLVKEAYLIVEDGYKDSPSTKLKYPHHVIKNGELVLHVSGVQAALSRARQQGLDGEPISHLKKHYEELGLDMENFSIENKEKEVKLVGFNKNEFAVKFGMTANDMMEMMREASSKMKYQVEDREYSKYWMIDYDENYIYAYDEQEGGKVAIPYSIEDGKVKCDFENVKPCKTMTQWIILDEAEDDDDSVMMAIVKAKEEKEAFAKSKEEQENNEEEDDKENKDKENDKENEDKEKQFSVEEIKKELDELKVEFASLKESNEQLKNENEQLKKFKSDIEENEKNAKIEFTLNEAVEMGMPKDMADKYREKAKEFSVENIHIWVNEVKANMFDFAKEKTKDNKDEGFIKVGLTWATESSKKRGLWD